MSTPLQTAMAAWGPDLPDWIEAMAIECGDASQAAVARALGRSGSMISQVLRNRYAGDLAALEEVFRGAYMQARVHCPALGAIPTNDCQTWRRKARQFVTGNPLRVRMYRACTQCPRNREERK